jgi:peptidoglycan/xylan/chitin deacetylase (PgdA/CDA1 family)
MLGFLMLSILPGYAGEVTVVLRFDDYAGSLPSPFERRLVELCEKYGLALTVGVIPFVGLGAAENPEGNGEFPLGPAKVEFLADLVLKRKVEIALHGYSHRTRSAQDLSEFEGMPFAEQLEKIGKGKRYLEDAFHLPVTTFIPPWNQYDEVNVAVLEKLGFQTLSAGTRSRVTTECALRVLPATCDLSKVKEAITWARRQGHGAGLVVAGFHAYDFVEVDSNRGKLTVQLLEELLAWLAAQPDVKTQTLSQILQPYLTMANFQKHKWNWFVCRRMPPFLVGPKNYVYGEKSGLGTVFYWNLSKAVAWYLFVAGAVALVVWASGMVLLGRIPFRELITKRRLFVLCAVAVILVVGYGCRHLSGSYKELTITFVGTGILLAAGMLPASVFQRSRVGQPSRTSL